jgi:hypothetical protein
MCADSLAYKGRSWNPKKGLGLNPAHILYFFFEFFDALMSTLFNKYASNYLHNIIYKTLKLILLHEHKDCRKNLVALKRAFCLKIF